MVDRVIVPVGKLHALAASLLEAAGLQRTSAHQVADALVWADSRGTDSHGVSRLPMYVSLLESGEMDGSATVHRRLRLPALTVLDGNRCAGAVGMQAAATEAMSAAREAGIGMCFLCDTTHTGALGYFTGQVARAGMIGIAGAASGPHMAYHNAATAGVSTSPLSIAAPGDEPIVFDMSAGTVALGKLLQAKAAGESIPSGWALDAEGRPTTDPAAAKTPLPLGGPKGSGLALMMEMMTSLVVGNPILAPALAVPASRRRHCQNAFVLAIDVGSVTDIHGYLADVNALATCIKALPPQEGQEILLPGERGLRQSAVSSKSGIPLRKNVLKALEQLAQKYGADVPW